MAGRIFQFPAFFRRWRHSQHLAIANQGIALNWGEPLPAVGMLQQQQELGSGRRFEAWNVRPIRMRGQSAG